MNTKDKVEAYVREHCPDLAFTVVCRTSAKHPDGVRKTWRKPQLQHWLRILDKVKPNSIWCNDGNIYFNNLLTREVKFNLTTGQPATEADYQALAEILNIEV